MMFFTPTLTTSVLVVALQRFVEGQFNVVVMFTIVGALSQLKKSVLAIADATERYNDFLKSYENYNIFLD